MRYLLLSSCLLVLLGCNSAYKGLKPATGDISALNKFEPDFTVALYKTEVNVTGKYLSGLLLIKTMPDSSIRMLFSNEIGFKFFDFAFYPDGKFKVYSIIKQMDKKAVITTLRKDFELVLMQRLDDKIFFIKKDSIRLYYGFPQVKGFNYYITDMESKELIRMERASNRKPVVEVIMKNYVKGVPDTIGITHKNFNFTIGLKRIER